MTNLLLVMILVSSLVTGLVLLGFGLVVARYFSRLAQKVERYEAEIRELIEPVADGQPSPLASAIDAASQVAARAITAQLKTTFMGIESGARRGASGIAADVVEDAAAGSPIGAILSSFPTVRKSLRRNPGLIDVALGLVGNMSQRGNGGNGHMPVEVGKPRFKL